MLGGLSTISLSSVAPFAAPLLPVLALKRVWPDPNETDCMGTAACCAAASACRQARGDRSIPRTTTGACMDRLVVMPSRWSGWCRRSDMLRAMPARKREPVLLWGRPAVREASGAQVDGPLRSDPAVPLAAGPVRCRPGSGGSGGLRDTAAAISAV